MLISVIMPCYNAASYIKEAVSSVLAQTYGQFELIIVNDGSTDDSEQVINSFRDDRIRYFSQPNRGQSAACNYGLGFANGDYIKFFDADDLMNPEHLELQVKRMNGARNILVSSEWGRFYDDNYRSAKFVPELVWRDMDSMDWLVTALSQKSDMMGLCIWLIPKELLAKTGGWDERLSLNNDFEFSTRLLVNSEKVLFAEGAKVYYRTLAAGTLSRIFSEKSLRSAMLSTDLGLQMLLAHRNTAETRLLAANRYQEWVYRIYPDFPELVQELEQKIAALGGSDRKIEGGRFFLLLSGLLGWKKTKRIKSYLGRVGYRKLPFNGKR